jgi:prophage DNA circulation protein
MNIFDLPSGWRDRMMPASLNRARFHCEANSRESGRRSVLHQFPKKDLPYTEDMGQAAREFTVRGYCIGFPYDAEFTLYRRDYTLARDQLVAELEQEGPHTLQLPTQASQQVISVRYRLTEEERFGGFCIIDMTFQEYGLDPQLVAPATATGNAITVSSEVLRSQVLRTLVPQLQVPR